jgi:Tfp pilus assembly protein PilN
MIRINLAPTRTRARASIRFAVPAFNLGLAFTLLYAVAGTGVVFTWWTLTREEARLTAEVDAARRELSTLNAVVAQSAQAKAQLAELKQRVQTLTQLTRAQGQALLIMDAFADAVPTDVWITGIEERSAKLKVTGAAFSTTAVSDLMSNLRRSGKFKEVDIVVARQDLAKTPSLVTFEVTCRFES